LIDSTAVKSKPENSFPPINDISEEKTDDKDDKVKNEDKNLDIPTSKNAESRQKILELK